MLRVFLAGRSAQAGPLRWFGLIALAALLSSSAIGKNLTPVGEISWQPTKIVNGSPVLFQLSAPKITQSVSGIWLSHHLDFFHAGNLWYALGGVPVETGPGVYELRLTEALASGKAVEISRKIKITR